MNIRLNIAGIDCLIRVTNEKWNTFLAKRYREFLWGPKSKPSFKLDLVIRKRNTKITYMFDETTSQYILFFPNNLRRFKRFNTYFKFFFSSALLLSGKGFLLHASALEINKKGYVFCGKQGSGKSTILKNNPTYKPLSDDATILVKIKNVFFVQGSPFYEKNRLEKSNILVPVAKIFFLQKAKENRVSQMTALEKFRQLVANVYIKQESEIFNRQLYTNLVPLCYSMVKSTRIYQIALRKRASISKLIYK